VAAQEAPLHELGHGGHAQRQRPGHLEPGRCQPAQARQLPEEALERAMHGQPPNVEARSFFEPERPFSEIAPLAAAQRAVDRRLVDLCVALTDDRLDSPVGVMRRDGVLFEPATRLLAHLFQHQIHHRGQAHAMLAGTSVKPPQLDEFFCANEAHLRREELAELGYSEAQIWGTRS